MEDGMPAYHRDGRTIAHGFFGSGLKEAVRGVPAAEEAAKTYHDRTVGGFVAMMVGVGCFATMAFTAPMDRSWGHDSTRDTVFITGAACGMAGLITGSVLMISGQPYHFDALNLYNDAAEAQMAARMWHYPPPLVVPAPPGASTAPGFAPAPRTPATQPPLGPPPAPPAAPSATPPAGGK
jgi:hypothetical protein